AGAAALAAIVLALRSGHELVAAEVAAAVLLAERLVAVRRLAHLHLADALEAILLFGGRGLGVELAAGEVLAELTGRELAVGALLLEALEQLVLLGLLGRVDALLGGLLLQPLIGLISGLSRLLRRGR